MKKKTTTKIIIVLNIIFSIVWLLPLYWAFVTSIKTEKEIYGGITLIPHQVTFQNYAELFRYRDGVFFTYLGNSIILCAVTMLLVCLISVLAGFAFSKLELLASKLWLSLSLVT